MNSLKNSLLAAVVCFQTSGMTCGNCVQKIKAAFNGRPGVSSTEVSLVTGVTKLQTTRPLTKKELQDSLTLFKQLKYPAREVPCPP